MKIKTKLLASLFFAVALLMFFVSPVCAVNLPDGSVRGLPEKLAILDDSGNHASASGEYYFVVEDMQESVTYTKKIQIMNLREDADYNIWFSALPLTNEGDIDLQEECDCKVYLNDTLIYDGKITGEGNPDIRRNPLDLGLYKPGQSRVLKVDVTWNDTNAGGHIDNGAKVVDSNGTTVVREPSGKTEIWGETTFKWIFSAQVRTESAKGTSNVSKPDNNGQPSFSDASTSVSVDEISPNQPVIPEISSDNISDFIQTGETVVFVTIAVVMAATLMLFFLLIGKKKKQEKK